MSDYRFRANLRVENLPDDRCALACGEEPILIFSGPHKDILKELEIGFAKGIQFADLIENVDEITQYRYRELLEFLIKEGAVTNQGKPPDNESDIFFDTIVSVRNINTKEKIVSLVGSSEINSISSDILEKTGFSIVLGDQNISDSDVVLVDCNSIGFEAARHINKKAINLGTCVLYVFRPSMFESVIGPFVIPRVTACLECFVGRWSANGNFLSSAVFNGSDNVSGLKGPASVSHGVASCATMEIVYHLMHINVPSTWGGILVRDNKTNCVERHNILKLPNCRSCSNLV